ncbi:hypothetical protein PUNSTDRAFT_22768, partial [Punctularia strigosozonata HHB-11173 SS5]
PENELTNERALRTIASHAYLFRIVTPVNVDLFEELLATHPNQPFVESVVHGFRNGFWPAANTNDTSLPSTWDNAHRPLRDPRHVQFLAEYRDKEVESGRWSMAFGTELMDGMYSMPIGVVPKGENSFRLVNDDSAGEFSVNAMIPRVRPSIPMDNVIDLGAILR